MSNEIEIKAKNGNMTPIVRRAIESAEENTVLMFEAAEYHFYGADCYEGEFYPSNNKSGRKRVIFPILGKKGLTIEGNGARFIFHERVFPFIVQNSERITLRAFSVDFEFPRNYQAVVVNSTEEYLDFYIDKKRFPYSIRGGNVICHAEGGDVTSRDYKFFLSDYDKDVEEGTTIASIMIGDCTMDPENFPADGLKTDALELGGGIVRFLYRKNSPKLRYYEGHRIVVHYDEDRENDTFFLDDSRDVAFENVSIYRGPGMGIIAQLTENISLKGLRIGCKDGRDDLISTTADALHFVNCSGKGTLKNSYVAHSLDDAWNLHGVYTHIEAAGDKRLLVRLGHREQSGFNPYKKGDVVEVIDGKTLEIKAKFTIASAVLTEDFKHISIEAAEKIPSCVKENDYLENPGRMPEVEMTDNEIFKCPSILISTSKRVYFARNKIHTRCAGLRITDSLKLWYESGRSRDVTVENNDFIHCGEGYDEYMIRIAEYSEHEENAIVHKNIKIAGNRFTGKNAKLLSVSCAENVEFSGNTYRRARAVKGEREACPFSVEDSRNIRFFENDLEL